jgi:hypothetical protein
MRINVTMHDRLEREALIDVALSAHLALLTTEGRQARRRDRRIGSVSPPVVTCSQGGSASCARHRTLARLSRSGTSTAMPRSSPTR